MKTGEQVVCIDVTPRNGGRVSGLKLGAVYTISGWYACNQQLLLVLLGRASGGPMGDGYFAWRFAPLISSQQESVHRNEVYL